MFRMIENILTPEEVAELRKIGDEAQFVDGKISNPHSTVKDNLHLNDQQAHRRCVEIMAKALLSNEDLRNFAVPRQCAPPILTRYEPGMRYGIHPDAALMPIGNTTIRADISCTIFLDPPESYEGGHLRICLGTEEVRIKGNPGSAILYPSHTLHEVEKVTSGRRLVGLTFIQSRIQDTRMRELLYELGEVAALEGLKMDPENYARLQSVQFNLSRMLSEN